MAAPPETAANSFGRHFVCTVGSPSGVLLKNLDSFQDLLYHTPGVNRLSRRILKGHKIAFMAKGKEEELITQAVAAEIRGVTPQAINELVPRLSL
jgi:hypothetical protein